MNDLKYWIWLSRIPELGSKKIEYLLQEYQTPENIWNLDKSQLLKINCIGTKTADDILSIEYRQNIDKYLEYMDKNNIEIININDSRYPFKLKNIYDPPMILYIRGNAEILNDFSISIIGCRNYSEYGKRVAKQFSYNLSQNKVNIISGLARGIDSFAHIGCLEANGKTIAVIGNGLDNIYPSENKYLANNIIKNGGTILSEYIVGTKPTKTNFPQRNRIISGLSNGILVIEAKEKSGTLITVDFGLEQGKNIFVIPGDIYNINSVGTNELIKQGAKLVTNINDVLEEYI